MTTVPAVAHPRLVHLTKLLPPPALDEHRGKVGLRLEVLVRKTDKFGWDRMDPNVRTILRKDWMDALQDFTLEEIDEACRESVRANPDKCPNEGHIRQIIIRGREAIRAALPKPEEKQFVATEVPVEERRAVVAEVLGKVGRANG
mgnify:FL=1